MDKFSNDKELTLATITLRDFINPSQLAAMKEALQGEEGAHFRDKIIEAAAIATSMPKTYEQDGKGDAAVAHLHYFANGMDWFITERDIEKSQLQAFGYCDLGMGSPELGYVSIAELIRCGVELDMFWTSMPLGKIKESRQ